MINVSISPVLFIISLTVLQYIFEVDIAILFYWILVTGDFLPITIRDTFVQPVSCWELAITRTRYVSRCQMLQLVQKFQMYSRWHGNCYHGNAAMLGFRVGVNTVGVNVLSTVPSKATNKMIAVVKCKLKCWVTYWIAALLAACQTVGLWSVWESIMALGLRPLYCIMMLPIPQCEWGNPPSQVPSTFHNDLPPQPQSASDHASASCTSSPHNPAVTGGHVDSMQQTVQEWVGDGEKDILCGVVCPVSFSNVQFSDFFAGLAAEQQCETSPPYVKKEVDAVWRLCIHSHLHGI